MSRSSLPGLMMSEQLGCIEFMVDCSLGRIDIQVSVGYQLI